jgi:hypothetical protein
MGMGIVWQDDAINAFMCNFVSDLDMQILKCLTVPCHSLPYDIFGKPVSGVPCCFFVLV